MLCGNAGVMCSFWFSCDCLNLLCLTCLLTHGSHFIYLPTYILVLPFWLFALPLVQTWVWLLFLSTIHHGILTGFVWAVAWTFPHQISLHHSGFHLLLWGVYLQHDHHKLTHGFHPTNTQSWLLSSLGSLIGWWMLQVSTHGTQQMHGVVVDTHMLDMWPLVAVLSHAPQHPATCLQSPHSVWIHILTPTHHIHNPTTSSPLAKKIQCSCSFTVIRSSGVLVPSPLCNCARYDRSGLPICVRQVSILPLIFTNFSDFYLVDVQVSYHIKSIHTLGMKHAQWGYPVTMPQSTLMPTTLCPNGTFTPTTPVTSVMTTPSTCHNLPQS